jgi:hypothetical protein
MASLTEYNARSFLAEEKQKLSLGWFILRHLTPMLRGKEIATAATQLYAYFRYIDDVVDEGKDHHHAHQVLREELSFIRSLLENPNAYTVDELSEERQLVLNAIEVVPVDEQHQILEQIENGIKGIYLDNIAMTYGRPLPDFIQKQRNDLALLPYLQIITLLLFDRPFCEPKESHQFSPFFEAIVYYDLLKDLADDLSSGLVLIPRSLLRQYGISFENGHPIGDVSPLVSDLKEQAKHMIWTSADSIRGSNLPRIFSFFFSLYLRTKPRKIDKLPSISERIIFNDSSLAVIDSNKK